MPFKSQAQRKFMFAKHPKIAHEWSEKYGTPEDMPEHVGIMAKMKKKKMGGHHG
jgi:hypothetical protein